MTLAEFRQLRAGDAVRLGNHPGVVARAGVNTFGHRYASVRWVNEPRGSVRRHSYYSDGRSQRDAIRRLHRG